MEMNQQKRILIIDFCNYTDYPIGGYLSFAKYMLLSFRTDLALVGITTDKNDPVGKWFKKQINGENFDFFALAYYSKSKTKHVIPDRLVVFALTRLYKKAIMELGVNNVFIQRQEVLQSITNFKFKNICYRFGGMENPLAISKYWYAQFIAKYFEANFFKSLKTAKVILASGDESAICEMIERSQGIILRKNIVQFPSRINTDIYKPTNKNNARINLNIPSEITMVVTTGRLAPLKGWRFMIDSFLIFEKTKPGSRFYFIGEGEDLLKIEEYIITNKLEGKVILAGKHDAQIVAMYINASDLFIMGSYKEGWSTSLSEAIACGVPACVTNFSSAEDIIVEGSNGYIINNHDTKLFAQGMLQALSIPKPIFNENVMANAVNKLKADILKNWELI